MGDEFEAEGSAARQGDSALTGDQLLRYVSKLRQQLNALPLTDRASDDDGLATPEGERPTRVHGRDVVQRESGRVDCGARMHERTVAVVGLGRVGSRLAELLAKAGCGRLVLVDRARVALPHVESSAFSQAQVGLPKAQAARISTLEINPAADARGETLDLDLAADFEVFKNQLLRSTAQGWNTDVLVACVDSDTTRHKLNELSLELELPLLSIAVENEAAQASLSLVLPGRTACLKCLQAREEASQMTVPLARPVARSNATDRQFKSDLPGLALMLAGAGAEAVVKLCCEVGVVLPSLKFRFMADANAQGDGVRRWQGSKEYGAFKADPYVRCTEARCRELQELSFHK